MVDMLFRAPTVVRLSVGGDEMVESADARGDATENDGRMRKSEVNRTIRENIVLSRKKG